MPAVISENFTAFTDWRGAPSGGLCAACAWAYRTPALRAIAHLVTHKPPTLTSLSRTALASCLRRGDLTPNEALAVPLRAGRKHSLTAAAWGQVAVDDVLIRWTHDDVTRLDALARLRDQGASPTHLQQPAPPWTLISAATPTQRGAILTEWTTLEPWRTRAPWMELALLASTPGTPMSDHSVVAR